MLHGLVKQWIEDLKDDMEKPLQARFLFKTNLVGSMNQISCNLYVSVNKIVDGFSPCQVYILQLLCLHSKIFIHTSFVLMNHLIAI